MGRAATPIRSYKPFLLLVLFLCVSDHATVTANVDPPGGGSCINGQCPSQCSWTADNGVLYSLTDIGLKVFQTALPTPQGSHLRTSPCHSFLCNNKESASCITVPGLKPTSAGKDKVFKLIADQDPASGFQLLMDGGDVCEVTKKPRRTIARFPCDPNAQTDTSQLKILKSYEGQNKLICNYFVDFAPSQLGCPTPSSSGSHLIPAQPTDPVFLSVTGCVDSDPSYSTSNCHYGGGQVLSLHGLWFSQLCRLTGDIPKHPSTSTLLIDSKSCTKYFREHYEIKIGSFSCSDPNVFSTFVIKCTLEAGTGTKLPVTIETKQDQRDKKSGAIVGRLDEAVSYREHVNLKDQFSRFSEYGVGGLRKEIEELYRRAFASRGASPQLLKQLGISHIKGILLYGPPGAGKTLLARTIAKILGSEQVQLINGPEIISKFLGESERNLRSHFMVAQEAYKKLGDSSDLYVVIIDEIDAICKPRGKSDQSAASAAYDSLVNQLLTLMDGLHETNNILVIGMTNRKELLDRALLRPGRFEVQIEVGLPDEAGRYEIFDIHTRSMRDAGALSKDVNLRELAANTTRFSGAEIAGVVRAAASFALEKQQTDLSSQLQVTSDNFQRALREVTPAYTHSEMHIVSQFLPPTFLSLGLVHEATASSLLDIVHSLRQSSTTAARMQSVLLYGQRGTGKTSLAAHIAVLGHFSFVKILTASSMIGLPDSHKVDLLHQTFNDAFRSEFSLIVLDDLHRLVEYVQVASQLTVSHAMMHAVNTLLSSSPPAGSSVMVVATMTLAGAHQLSDSTVTLGLPDLFTWSYPVPLMRSAAVQDYLTARRILRNGGGVFSLSTDLSISVKQLQHVIECVCVQSDSCSTGSSQSAPSYIHQNKFIDCINSLISRKSSHSEQSGSRVLF